MLFNDGAGVELGVMFTASVNGVVSGVRFYKDVSMTGATRVGHLWSADGTKLAEATFTETASGWQQVNFSSPVPVTASTSYVASYFAPDGKYFATKSWPYPSSNPPLTANLGFYRYPPPSFPDTASVGNYWADVVFQPAYADVSITKTAAPDPVLAGGTFTYTLSVANAGSSPATGVTTSDTLPGGVGFVSAGASQGSCEQSSGTVTCSLGTMASGAGATVSINVTAPGKGTISNAATVKANEPDPNLANNTSTTTSRVVALAGGAFGEQLSFTVLGLTVSSPPTPSVTLPSGGGGPFTSSLATVGMPGILSFDTLKVSTQGGSGSAISVDSSADVAKANIMIGGVTADTVHSQCSAKLSSTSGSSKVAGLMINGKAVSATGGRIDIPGVGTLILNEQTTSPSGVLTVNAMHLVLNGRVGTGDIVVAQSRCGIES
jgi:uncharacterized repeat protein (TIGR01451 family)